MEETREEMAKEVKKAMEETKTRAKAKPKFVNNWLAWGLIVAEFAIIAIICLVVFC